MSSGPGLLEFDGVSFVAPDGTELLRGVDLRAEAGLVTVLVGPSGAGKSTLLRLANRLSVPSSGSVRLDGVDCARIDPLVLRRRIGMVFQRPTPFPGSVRDNLRVARPSLTDPEAHRELSRVGLDPLMIDRTADDLSGGEAQRACIARALLTDPEVLLMDEPTSALDPDSRVAIEGLAHRLSDEGLAIVWVTHDLAQARRLTDRIVVIVDGRNATAEETADYLGDRDGSA